MYETEIGIPRHGAGPREVARSGEIWRLFQEVAMRATTAAGWPPERYRAAGTSFVIYGMTGRHHREIAYGEALSARTWVYDFKRGTLTRRQIRLFDARGPVADCTQHWVHTDAALRPTRASEALLANFPAELPDEPPVSLPAFEALPPGPLHSFEFEPWHVWMDPLAHVNHPAYVDFCDEGLCRILAGIGVDPQGLVPVAEDLAFKAGAAAGQQVRVETRLVGRTADGAAVFEHHVTGQASFARATTVRRHVGVDLAAVLGA